MKTLKEFIDDDMGLSHVSDYWDTTSAYPITRSSMPQIDVDDLKTQLDASGIPYWTVLYINANQLRPTQSDYDSEKVNAIANNLLNNNKTKGADLGPPIIVSNDGYVLDGHHRYIASNLTGIPLNVLKVDLPINKLYRFVVNMSDNEGNNEN